MAGKGSVCGLESIYLAYTHSLPSCLQVDDHSFSSMHEECQVRECRPALSIGSGSSRDQVGNNASDEKSSPANPLDAACAVESVVLGPEDGLSAHAGSRSGFDAASVDPDESSDAHEKGDCRRLWTKYITCCIDLCPVPSFKSAQTVALAMFRTIMANCAAARTTHMLVLQLVPMLSAEMPVALLCHNRDH